MFSQLIFLICVAIYIVFPISSFVVLGTVIKENCFDIIEIHNPSLQIHTKDHFGKFGA